MSGSKFSQTQADNPSFERKSTSTISSSIPIAARFSPSVSRNWYSRPLQVVQ